MKPYKTYVLTLAKVFPKGHPKAGQPTGFKEKFLKGEKIHTIRLNPDLWRKRIIDIQNGDAKLSIRQWSGKPYRSKQEIIKDIYYDLNGNIGYEVMDFSAFKTRPAKYGFLKPIIAGNDGLFLEDWQYWFTKELSADRKFGIIIHFTNFRYVKKYGA